MKTDVSRRQFVTQMGIAGTLATGAIAVSAKAQAQQDDDTWSTYWNGQGGTSQTYYSIPDRDHIKQTRRGWRVLPTGADDHDNLEWALNNTPAGGTVRLVAGTYKIGSPIVVPDFDGRLVGRGPSRTTMTCTDEFSLEVWEAPGGGRDQGLPKPPPFPRVSINGSATKTPPVLIQFYKTPLRGGERAEDRANHIEVRGIRCRGAMVGELWCFGDEVLCINVVNSVDWNDPTIRQETTPQDFTLTDVEVDGYRSPAFGPFENACACITVLGTVVLTANYNLEGEVDGDALGIANGGLLDVVPAKGDVVLDSCTFRNCRLGPGVVGYKDGTATFRDIVTDGCRGNCLQIVDVSNMTVTVSDCDLFCDSFILPPFLVGGITDLPSSQGCVVALQGSAAAVGFPANVQWFQLAYDEAAHARHPEAGPLGTWRPQGSGSIPKRSRVLIVDNECESSATPNTYCFHAVDLANFAYSVSSLRTVIANNSCTGSETCISVEHVDRGRVRRNDCESQAFGIELHNAPDITLRNNTFSFPPGADGCEVRTLSISDKIDLSRVVPGAGTCSS